jgi:hypothetical protein
MTIQQTTREEVRTIEKLTAPLPSEAPRLSYFNHLPKVWGKTAIAVPKQIAECPLVISRERYNPAYAADIRQHGGGVRTHTVHARCGGGPIFRVRHISGTGDGTFLSMPMMLEDHAAARVLGEFVGAWEVKLAPKAERVAGQGNPIAIQSKPAEIATTPEDRQQRRVARLFLPSPATIVRLAYWCAP